MKNKYHIFFTGMLSIAFFMGATVDTKAQDSIAVVSRVNIEHLKAMPDLQLSNTLQGQAAGLIVIPNTGGIGYANSTFYVRGDLKSTRLNSSHQPQSRMPSSA